jgi:hypothetical protein
VVLVAVDEIRCPRGDLHEVGCVPGAAKGDRVLSEEEIDVDRLVRLAGAAFLFLFNQAHDRREAVRKRLLVGQIRARTGREKKRGRRSDQRKYRDSAHRG